VPSGELFLSVLVIGEIRRGIERLRPTDPVQPGRFERWLEELGGRFADRILPVDAVVAEMWGRLSAIRPMPVEDGLMAATAAVHRMTFVTGNVRDVAHLGVPVLDPWSGSSEEAHAGGASPAGRPFAARRAASAARSSASSGGSTGSADTRCS
jgi:predicted nucleic acid-binding protein